jgi:hypothetical protein
MKSDRSMAGILRLSEKSPVTAYITQTKHPPLPIASRHKTEKIGR